MKTGIELIAEERQRQIDKEGWTPEHDDLHDADELAYAACSYAMPTNTLVDNFWPFSFMWWKPATRIRDLIKAGALIAAEIDRLQRADPQKEQPNA